MALYHTFSYPFDPDDEEEDRFMFLECPQCNGMLRQPVKVTPECGHQICERCVKGIVLHSSDKSVIYCPDCGSRNRVDRIKTDYQLSQTIEAIERADQALALAGDQHRIFFDKRRFQACPHLAAFILNEPNICRHCGQQMCDHCLLYHMEVVRLEIGWLGHNLNERYNNAMSKLNDVPDITALDLEIINLAKTNARNWSQKIDDLFKEESILTISPEELMDFYLEIIKRDKDVWVLENLVMNEVFPAQNDGEKALSGWYFWRARQRKPFNYVPKEKLNFYHAIDSGDLSAVQAIFENRHLPEPCKQFLISHFRLSEQLFGTAVHHAAFHGQTGVLRYLIEGQGADASAVCPFNEDEDSRKFAIHFAARNGHVETVKYLAELDPKMADVADSFGRTPLIEAAWNSRYEVLDYLIDERRVDIEHEDDWGQTAFSGLFEHEEGDFLVASYLIRKGARGVFSSEETPKDTTEWAVENGFVNIAKAMLERNSQFIESPIDRNGLTLLHLACAKGQLEIVKLLVNEFKANVEKKCTKFGRTALHYAARNVEIVKFLIDEAGADVMALGGPGDSQSTVAHLAARYGKQDVVSYLLERHPELANCQNHSGETPLQVTCAFRSKQMEKTEPSGAPMIAA